MLHDPYHMSDESLFGVWNPGGRWDVEPVLQYDRYRSLGSVLNRVKAGDYRKAKEELLHYFRERTGITEYRLTPDHQDAILADMMTENIFSFVQNDHGVGQVQVSTEWKYYAADLSELASAYFLLDNEMDGSYVEVYSKENPACKPAVLEVVVNGDKKTLLVIADTYISAGDNKNANYGNEHILHVREAAGTPEIPFGTRTARAYFRFDTGSITGRVTSIRLKFYARSSLGNKKIYVLSTANEKHFDESRLTWSGHYPQVFNFKETGYIWKEPAYHESVWDVEFEWLNFGTRLYMVRWLVARYLATGDEAYSYCALEAALSLYGRQESGVYPRILEGGWRIEYLCDLFFGTLNSKFMTPEVLAALLKYLYTHAKELKDVEHQTANWNSAVRVGYMRVCAYFPEMAHNGWWEHGKKRLRDMYTDDVMNPDGSYVESTSGYISGVVDELKLCLELIGTIENENDPSYRYLLDQYQRLAKYYFDMAMSDGCTPPWGDGGRSSIKAFAKAENAFYPNPCFEYFATDGKSGTEPEYRSIAYKDKAIAFLRSDWQPAGFSAMIHTDFGGNHSHYDDLGLDVYAYGVPLLVEAGNASYSPGSLLAKTRMKTVSHNTIEIDNIDQERSADMINVPQKLNLATNRLFDFVDAGSDRIYPGFSVNRKVLFLHHACWIVSDYISAPAGKHTYRQIWHPDARSGVTVDSATKAATTHYLQGANIRIVPADPSSLEVKVDEMYMFHPAAREIKADYVQYYRDNVAGPQTFDTVLYPCKEGEGPAITVTRIPLENTATITATALRIRVDGNTGCYYSSNEAKPTARSFGEYAADGQMAYVETDSNGEVIAIALTRTTSLSKGNTSLVSSGEALCDLGIRWHGNTLNLYSSAGLPEIGIRIYSERPMTSVTLNGKAAVFTYWNNTVTTNGSPAGADA